MTRSRSGLGQDHPSRDVIARSSLRRLPDALLEELVAGARLVDIPAGATIHHEGEDAPHLELVLSGLLRVHVSAADGRTMTIRYCRSGALIGAATLYAAISRPFAIQALARSELLQLRPAAVRALAERDPRVTSALLAETSERVLAFVGELSASAFASVRERVGRHLLDLAADQQHGEQLVAGISQQQLADAVGSVREVVVRVLRDLRREGVVETRRGAIHILDPGRLIADPETAPPGERAGHHWNTGS